ncbi:MAG: triose-phosphate isomerase [Actinobacteria bacterium]|nr:triose-phosphate isomerase [Actinomycetota bacterium]
MRKPLIAGNWKMYKNNNEALELVRELAPLVADLDDVEVAVCPPFTALADVSRLIADSGSSIALGAQDVYPGDEGAFTGEISPPMLKALAVTYVIAGHSERRELMGEKDGFVATKVRAVLDAGMTPILCVGETLEEREAGNAARKVEGQLAADLEAVEAAEVAGMVIAYEPIWAIGTGKTATPDDAQGMNSAIRRWIAASFGDDTAASVRILYGGSVKPGNAAELMALEDIDGALVGGASLKAADFAAIAGFKA